MTRKNTDRGNWLIIAILIVLASPAVFLFGFMLGSGISLKEFSTAENFGLWLGAISTLVIAVLTIVLAKETWHLRIVQIEQAEELQRQSIRPQLEFYLMPAPVSFQFLNVHVENSGTGVARNIKFSFDADKNNSLRPFEKELIDQLLEVNFLKNGIASLGSGKERKSYVFSFIRLAEKLGDDAFDIRIAVNIEYQDIEGYKYSTQTVVDFSEFKGISEIGGGDPIYNLYKEVEKLRKLIEGNVASMRSKRLNLNVFTPEDNKNEMEKIKKQFSQSDKNDS